MKHGWMFWLSMLEDGRRRPFTWRKIPRPYRAALDDLERHGMIEVFDNSPHGVGWQYPPCKITDKGRAELQRLRDTEQEL